MDGARPFQTLHCTRWPGPFLGSQRSLGPLLPCIVTQQSSWSPYSAAPVDLSGSHGLPCQPYRLPKPSLRTSEHFPPAPESQERPGLTARTWAQADRTVSMAHWCLTVSPDLPRAIHQGNPGRGKGGLSTCSLNSRISRLQKEGKDTNTRTAPTAE